MVPSNSWREVIAGLLSIAIAAVSFWMLLDTYFATEQSRFIADEFSRKKDMLSIGLGLLGTVIGYYFGRVPAEKQADAARGEAAAAMKTAKAAEDDKDRVRKVASNGVDEIERLTRAGGGSVNPDGLKDAVRRLREALN
jgi:hypothetical protein